MQKVLATCSASLSPPHELDPVFFALITKAKDSYRDRGAFLLLPACLLSQNQTSFLG